MVSSPYYQRLKEFMKAAEENKNLDAWNDEHEKSIKGFDQAVERLKAYRDGHGFQGEAAKAMEKWVNESIDRIEGYRARYEAKYDTYQGGREVMAKALDEAGNVSDTLVDPVTAAMGYLPVVSVPSSQPGGGFSVGPVRFTTGAAYVEGVEAQNNAQREEACKRILKTLNGELDRQTETMSSTETTPKIGDPTKDKDKGGDDAANGGGGSGHGNGGGSTGNTGGGGHGYGGGGYSPENGFGREGGRNGEGYPGGFDKPWWSEADAAAARNRVIASGAVPTKELPYGELGSRTNPITDPQDLMDTDLLHTRVNGTTYRNGVVGGHTPAPAADAGHPLWRLNSSAAADAATAGRLGGAGVLGAGALGMRGAARMGSGFGGASGSAGGLGAAGLRGITGTTGSAGAMGASNLRVGSYSGSGFGSYTPPASMTGANGAAGAGASGVTGTTGAGGGSGAAGAAGAAGRGGAGAGGGFMGGAGAGAGMGKDDKKGRKRKYVAFTVDDDEDDLPAGYVNPLSQTYGTDRTITPVKREDDGWDLRQW